MFFKPFPLIAKSLCDSNKLNVNPIGHIVIGSQSAATAIPVVASSPVAKKSGVPWSIVPSAGCATVSVHKLYLVSTRKGWAYSAALLVIECSSTSGPRESCSTSWRQARPTAAAASATAVERWKHCPFFTTFSTGHSTTRPESSSWWLWCNLGHCSRRRRRRRQRGWYVSSRSCGFSFCRSILTLNLNQTKQREVKQGSEPKLWPTYPMPNWPTRPG